MPAAASGLLLAAGISLTSCSDKDDYEWQPWDEPSQSMPSAGSGLDDWSDEGGSSLAPDSEQASDASEASTSEN